MNPSLADLRESLLRAEEELGRGEHERALRRTAQILAIRPHEPKALLLHL